MALTRYKFTATGTTTAGDPAEGNGQVDAENPRDAEAMVIGFMNSKGVQATDINLTLTPGCTQ
ncbi:hypothetical protein ACFV6B_29170 [Streptomyces microflavus]|uniref:hypothetical protein n=1 Tax=Streptomyces microflavus TaxID=1919 RepID=UPI003656C6F1